MSIHTLTADEMDAYIDKYLAPEKKATKQRGEVFTPAPLVREILGKFPAKTFKNPSLTWLDPCAGVGNFMVILYQMLMNGLESWEKNHTKRSTHIINNMLFMNEIDDANCSTMRKMFGKTANIFCTDFLTDDMPTKSQFNCIIGNPPFQHYYGKTKAGRNILGGKNKLYEKIFLKAHDISNGYIAFVVPDRMVGGNGSAAYNIMLTSHVMIINLGSELNAHFPTIQQPICYFLLQKLAPGSKSATNKATTIIEQGCHRFDVVLKDRPVNPIRDWSKKTDALISKHVDNARNNVVYNRGKPLHAYKGRIYTLIYTPDKFLHTNSATLAAGLGVKKAIIFAISPRLEFKMDFTGEFGAGPNTFYVPFYSTDEGRKIATFLNSDACKTMAHATRTSRQYLKIAFVEHLVFPINRTQTQTMRTKHGHKKKTRKKR